MNCFYFTLPRSKPLFRIFTLSVPPMSKSHRGCPVAGAKTNGQVLSLPKSLIILRLLLHTYIQKLGRSFFKTFFPALQIFASVGIPVKIKDASWCGHKSEMRKNPLENGEKATCLRCEIKFSVVLFLIYYSAEE